MSERRCPRCERHLPMDAFNFRDAERTRPQSYCRECSNAAWREWYADPGNGTRHREQVAARRARRRERDLARYRKLKSGPCQDCQRRYPPEAMDFDHLDGKEADVSALIGTYSWSRVQAEIDKCDLVCANCHRIRTAGRARTGDGSGAG